MENKYVVPEGMMSAGMTSGAGCGDYSCNLILATALRWLSENPIVPTDAFLQEMLRKPFFRNGDWTDPQVFRFCEEWQRRMFLAPKPTVPEEIKDLLHTRFPETPEIVHESIHAYILEAFRRGQKAAK